MTGSELDYFVTYKNEILIVTIFGEINSTSLPIFTECIKEINSIEDTCSFIVLYMRDVSQVTKDSLGIFSKFLENLKKLTPDKFKICSAKPSLRVLFLDSNITTKDVFTNNLKETTLELLKK